MQFLENEFPKYYKYYIELASKWNINEGLEKSYDEFLSMLENVSSENENYAYAEEKWTIKELLLHIIDTERVFQYRALRFARNDKAMLPGFDENEYSINSNAVNRSLESIRDEFIAVRKSTIVLFSTFSDEVLLQMGNASNNTMSVRALGYTIIGHQQHHLSILSKRYL